MPAPRRTATWPILALSLVFAFEAAAAAYASSKNVITHYHWTAPPFDEISRAAAAAFMARNPGVEVKIIFLPDLSRADVIRTVLASGRPIDTYGLHSGEAAEFLAAGQAVPIDPAAFGKRTVAEVAEMWSPGAIEACGGKWDGRYYGIPFELSNYVAWVNTMDMKEAGLDPARDKPPDLGRVRPGGSEAHPAAERPDRAQRLHVQLQAGRDQLPDPAGHDGAARP